MIDLSLIFPMQKSEFKISISVECYDEKLMKLLRCEKAYSLQTIKDIESKF